GLRTARIAPSDAIPAGAARRRGPSAGGCRAAALDLAGRFQMRLPGGIEGVAGRGVYPGVVAGRLRPGMEDEACLVRQPIALAHVAGTTARHHVFPCVFATPGTGKHVVDALGLAPAVLARVPVPAEN